jgi:steroid delta-isomerase-like uncharacterized protein
MVNSKWTDNGIACEQSSTVCLGHNTSRMKKSKQSLATSLFAAWNSHDVEQILAHYADEMVRQDLTCQQRYSKADLEKTIHAYLAAFPDIFFEVEKMIEEGEQLVICWKAAGHHRGKIHKIPATGRHIHFRGVSVLEIADGKIAKVWYLWDEAGMLRQMGLLTELRQAV